MMLSIMSRSIKIPRYSLSFLRTFSSAPSGKGFSPRMLLSPQLRYLDEGKIYGVGYCVRIEDFSLSKEPKERFLEERERLIETCAARLVIISKKPFLDRNDV